MKKATRSTALAIKHAQHRYSSMPRPMPIVIKQTKVVKPKKHRRPHHHGGGGLGLGGLMSKHRMGIVAGALAVGFLEKQGFMANLPSLPFIGRTGTIGLGAYLVSSGGKNKLADDICTAALVIAAHELGSTGTIVGEEPLDVGYVAGY
jgi:hypothetical protein